MAGPHIRVIKCKKREGKIRELIMLMKLMSLISLRTGARG